LIPSSNPMCSSSAIVGRPIRAGFMVHPIGCGSPLAEHCQL
jgi:hypothetical protein